MGRARHHENAHPTTGPGGLPDSGVPHILGQTPIGVAVSRDAKLIYVDPTFAAMYGYDDPGELTGADITAFVAPSDVPAALSRARDRQMGLPTPQVCEAGGLRRDGTEFPVLASVLPIELPDGPAVLGMFQDLSALRTAEAALRQSEDKFTAAFHTSPDAVTINRLSDGLYLAVNEGFCNLLRYTPDEVIGKKSVDDLGIWAVPEDRERLVTGLRESGSVDNLESLYRGSDGSLHIALMSARVMDFGGERAILAVTRDITQRKAAEDEIRSLNHELTALNRDLEDRVAQRTLQLTTLNEELTALNEELISTNAELAQANSDLDAATRAKSEFLASMSHELRTPLNSILGFSGTLMGGMAGTLTDEQRRQVAMINNSGRHLLELINGVLDLAKLESGHDDLSLEVVDPCAIMLEVVESIRPLAEAKRLNVQTRCSDPTPSILTDRRRVRQILLNLLGNAMKFTDTGCIGARVYESDGDVLFEVRDTGCGVSPADAPHVFDQFYQGRPERGGKTAGTGLGLSVSLALASALGGDVEMDSEPGAGSTFTLRLPARPPIA